MEEGPDAASAAPPPRNYCAGVLVVSFVGGHARVLLGNGHDGWSDFGGKNEWPDHRSTKATALRELAEVGSPLLSEDAEPGALEALLRGMLAVFEAGALEPATRAAAGERCSTAFSEKMEARRKGEKAARTGAAQARRRGTRNASIAQAATGKRQQEATGQKYHC